MNNFKSRYKRQVRYLLKLCLDAQEKGIEVRFNYSTTYRMVDVWHCVDDKLVNNMYVFLNNPDNAEDRLNEMIQYVTSLLKGDSHVCTG